MKCTCKQCGNKFEAEPVEKTRYHKLLTGDATKPEDVARVMGADKADMLLTDLPYGVSYVGKTQDALVIDNDALDEDGLAELVRNIFGLAESNCRAGAYWYATVPGGPLHLIFAADWKRRGILRQIAYVAVCLERLAVLGLEPRLEG
jgi:hypothetical protein